MDLTWKEEIKKYNPPNYGKYTFTEEDYGQIGDISSFKSNITKIWNIAQENHMFSKNLEFGVYILVGGTLETLKKFYESKFTHKRVISIRYENNNILIYAFDKYFNDKIVIIPISERKYLKYIKFFSLCIQNVLFLLTLHKGNLKKTIEKSKQLEEGSIYPIVISKDAKKISRLNPIFKYIPYSINMKDLIENPSFKNIGSNVQSIFYDEIHEDPLFWI